MVVATYHNVAHTEMIYRIGYDRHGAQVGIGNHVGNVAVHKHFSGFNTHQLLGTHAAVGTPNVKNVGVLPLRELVEVVLVGSELLIYPLLVVGENLLDVHGNVVLFLCLIISKSLVRFLGNSLGAIKLFFIRRSHGE